MRFSKISLSNKSNSRSKCSYLINKIKNKNKSINNIEIMLNEYNKNLFNILFCSI